MKNPLRAFTDASAGKWLFTSIAPLAIWGLLLHYSTLNNAQAAFIAVTAWAICAWVTNIFGDVIVGIMLPGLYIVFCQGVDFGVVYGPWRSEIWILAVGGFILSAIIEETGLGRYIAMNSVRLMGGSVAGAIIGFMLGAIILSPLIPSIMGKTAIFCGIAVSLCEALGLKKGGREGTAIALGTIIAVAATKIAWLTGSGDTIMGMGILDSIAGTHTSWMQYAIYNAPPALLYTVLSVALVILVLRPPLRQKPAKDGGPAPDLGMPPMNGVQKRALCLLLLTIVLLATDNFHGLSAGIIMMLIPGIAALPAVNLLDARRLSKINFAPIFFIMGCMAIGSAGSYLKVTQWMAGILMPLFADSDSLWMTVYAYMAGAGANFLLTPLGTVSTLTAPLAELGLQTGVDPALLYFAFQYGVDNIIFPYEYAIYLYFYATGWINLRYMLLVMSIRMVLTAFFIAWIARPYWEFMLK